MPYVEQSAAYDTSMAWITANPTLPTYNAAHTNRNTKYAVYTCPSDPNGGRVAGEGFHGNYVANNGNTVYWANTTALPRAGKQANTGVILAGDRLKLTHITDGTSNTLLASETIGWPTGDDRRGRIWNSYQGETMFSTQYTPNTSSPDVQYSCGSNLPPHAPCTAVGSGANSINSARSYHSGLGGVNVVMCDGSTRFIMNNVNAPAWSAAGTRLGGESIGLN